MKDEMKIIKLEKQVSTLYEYIFALQTSIDRLPAIVLVCFLLGLIVGVLL